MHEIKVHGGKSDVHVLCFKMKENLRKKNVVDENSLKSVINLVQCKSFHSKQTVQIYTLMMDNLQ